MGNKFVNSSSIKRLLFNKQRHLHIIGLYMDYKQLKFENQLQVNAQVSRMVRPAKQLLGYDDDRIETTFKFLDKDSNFDKIYIWGLETVLKRIDIVS